MVPPWAWVKWTQWRATWLSVTQGLNITSDFFSKQYLGRPIREGAEVLVREVNLRGFTLPITAYRPDEGLPSVALALPNLSRKGTTYEAIDRWILHGSHIRGLPAGYSAVPSPSFHTTGCYIYVLSQPMKAENNSLGHMKAETGVHMPVVQSSAWWCMKWRQ